MNPQWLCHIDELDDPGSKGFRRALIPGSKRQQDIFLVRQGLQVFAYLNHCPHLGSSLNWVEDQFLNNEQEYIQCATHGALFEIANGYCVYGPCIRRSLASIPITIHANGDIVLQTRAATPHQ